MNILQARDFYTELGIDTIPLRPEEKFPLSKAWQKKEPRRMWNSAPQNANVGLRGGGEIGAAFLDCDDKNKAGTFENVTNFLHGLGVTEYPLIQTASGIGRHIYLTCTDALEGNACNLANAIGMGEFRYGAGAYIVAAPSVVSGHIYNVLSGDFAHIPNVSFTDLLPILGEVKAWKPSHTVPRNAFALLNGNAEAMAKFQSRSEAEQSLLLSLANAGFTLAEVEALFDHNRCAGKYTELRTINPRNAKRYLVQSFSKAQEFARKDSKQREIALQAIEWANNRAWPGRGGASEQAVFLAHMTIAYKAGTVESWAVGKRTLAELAGMSDTSKVNQRLLRAGFIKIARRSTVDCAQIYSIYTELPLPKNPYCEEVVTLCNNDVFRKTSCLNTQGKRLTSGFGPTGRQMWRALQSEPMNTKDLAKATGRCLRTVRKYLEKMRGVTDEMTGEVLSMVELLPTAEGEKWHTRTVDMDAVAVAVGTYGKGHEQCLKHAKERRMHTHDLMMTKRSEPVLFYCINASELGSDIQKLLWQFAPQH